MEKKNLDLETYRKISQEKWLTLAFKSIQLCRFKSRVDMSSFSKEFITSKGFNEIEGKHQKWKKQFTKGLKRLSKQKKRNKTEKLSFPEDARIWLDRWLADLFPRSFFPGTGKSLSEALLFAEHGENMCTKIVLNVRNNFCTQHVLHRFELEIFVYWTCNSMNNLSSYCGLVDAKIRASDKDLHTCIGPFFI